MDEVEWWEFGSAAELAEQVVGDIAFVIQSAIEAHGSARVALSVEDDFQPILSELVKRRDLDWSKVTLIPTQARLVPLDDVQSSYHKLQDFFGATGADLVSLVDEVALDDPAEAGRLADARLSLLDWPLDLAVLGIGSDGSTAGMAPGPDLERALSGPRERRAAVMRPDAAASGDRAPRLTLTAAAFASARAVMIVLAGTEKRQLLERAMKEGPLSSLPIGRVVANLDPAIDIFWSEQE